MIIEDPVTFITTIIAVLGIVGTAITSLKARKYLAVVVEFMCILGDYYKAIADGTVTAEEERQIGAKVISLGRSIDAAKDIPVTIEH